MTQLIINGTEYPEVWDDNYSAAPVEKSVQLRMSDLHLVEEIVGSYIQINWSCDYMEDALMRTCLSDLRSGEVLQVEYLPDDGDELVSGSFICTKKPTPQFAFSLSGSPRWHRVSFTLEGVDAVD